MSKENRIKANIKYLIQTQPCNINKIHVFSILLSDSLQQYDDHNKEKKKHLIKSRETFNKKGPKRHESRPHHLPPSKSVEESRLSGATDTPWRR